MVPIDRPPVLALVLAAAAVIVLSGCASQPMPPGADLPGFWWGLAHGIIAPFALIAEIFTDARIYAFPNNGGWYDLGFMLGISTWGGGGGATWRSRRRRRGRGRF